MNNQDDKVIVDYNDDWCFGCRGPDCEIVCCEGPCARSFCLECLGLKKFPEDEEWFCSKYCARSVQDICKEIKVKTTKNYPTPENFGTRRPRTTSPSCSGSRNRRLRNF